MSEAPATSPTADRLTALLADPNWQPTRADADRIFLEALEALNVGWVQRYALYLGVRVGARCKVRTTMVDYNTPEVALR